MENASMLRCPERLGLVRTGKMTLEVQCFRDKGHGGPHETEPGVLDELTGATETMRFYNTLTDHAKARAEVVALRGDRKALLDQLARVATTLDQWARESRAGGWSTHQCEPQQRLASELWTVIGRASVPGISLVEPTADV